MTQSINISVGNYGFEHNWTLVLEQKDKKICFFLGQDVKFCSRVLGMSPAYICEQIGTRDIASTVGNKKLAKFICKSLGLTWTKAAKLNTWDLCSQ